MKGKFIAAAIISIVALSPVASLAEGGYTWTERTGSGSRAWSHVAVSADGSTMIATVYGTSIVPGTFGNVYKSSDYGATWSTLSAAGARDWYFCSISADGTKMTALDRGGYIYVSTDGGVTWNPVTALGTGAWWRASYAPDGSYILAILPGGGVRRSTDDGATWGDTVPGPVSAGDLDISADSSVAAAIGNAITPLANLFVSTDRGVTWASSSMPRQGTSAYSGIGLSGDGSRMVATNYYGRTQVSVDTGATWASSTNDATIFEGRTVRVSSDGLVVSAINANNFTRLSTDGGQTLSAQASAGSRNWYATDVSDGGHKIAASVYNGYIWTAATADVTAPTLAIATSTGVTNGAFEVTVTANENLADMSLDAVTVTNGTASSLATSTDATVFTFDVTPSASGEVTVRLATSTVHDESENLNSAPSNLLSVTVDIDAPAVAVATPADGGSVASWSPSVDWDDAATCAYSVDSGAFASLDCSLLGADVPNPGFGDHVLVARGLDAVGNYGYATSTFTYAAPEDDGERHSSSGRHARREALGFDPAPRAERAAETSDATPADTPAPGTARSDFAARDLETGATGEDVRALQVFLNAAGFTLAAEGPGSPGAETDRFGALTRAALAKWQAAHGVAPAAGYYGPITRAEIGAEE